MHWYQEALRKYADFSTRSRRREYWIFFLMNFVISFILGFIGGLIGMRWIGVVYAVFVFIPALAVSVRRLHDTGRTGWWLLIAPIPLVDLVLLYFMLKDSDPGDNEYGPNPKAGLVA